MDLQRCSTGIREMVEIKTSRPMTQTMERDLARLPEEILLKIIFELRILNAGDMKSMKALGLTCRRMKDLTHDTTTINQMIKDQKIHATEIFNTTIWTPRTLTRLCKTVNETCNFVDTVWNLWAQNTQSPHLPVRHKSTLELGACCFLHIDGLEDNSPKYDLFHGFANHEVTAMLAAALVYQEVFMKRYLVVMPWLPKQQTIRIVRKGLRYVFLTQGPAVALRILENPLGDIQLLMDFDIPMIRDRLLPGQQLIMVTKERSMGGFPRMVTTLSQAIQREKLENVTPIPRHRIDLLTQWSVSFDILSWIYLGQSDDHFGPAGTFHDDMLDCYKVWQRRNPLL